MSTPLSAVTPAELARQLGHTDEGRAIRGWLRVNERRPEVEKRTRWKLTEAQANSVRAEFAGR